ncbi:MAG: cupin domain-containing protein [Burkholderiales bacterium]|nr:cupin domain-containing protein [Burkholderiales bacterium]
MGRMVDFSALAAGETGTAVTRAAITGPDTRHMSAELLRLAPGASVEATVPAGADLYLYALTGAFRIVYQGTTLEVAQDAFATLQEESAYALANGGTNAAEIISVLAPPPGGKPVEAGFRGGCAVAKRAGAPTADVPEQKKRRIYFVDDAAARSERAHAMIVEYQGDTVTVMHQHPNADSMFVPLTGKVRFTFDGRDHVLGRGGATVFPAGDKHGLRVEEEPVSFLEFHVPAGYVTVK